MHPVLRLYEDVLSSAEPVEFQLPPLPRFIFIVHGSAMIGEENLSDGESWQGPYVISDSDVEELYAIRKKLEVLALEFAVPRMNLQKLSEIRARIEAIDQSMDPDSIADIDEATRQRPPCGGIAALDQYHCPGRVVREFDDHVHGNRGCARNSHYGVPASRGNPASGHMSDLVEFTICPKTV